MVGSVIYLKLYDISVTQHLRLSSWTLSIILDFHLEHVSENLSSHEQGGHAIAQAKQCLFLMAGPQVKSWVSSLFPSQSQIHHCPHPYHAAYYHIPGL